MGNFWPSAECANCSLRMTRSWRSTGRRCIKRRLRAIFATNPIQGNTIWKLILLYVIHRLLPSQSARICVANVPRVLHRRLLCWITRDQTVENRRYISAIFATNFTTVQDHSRVTRHSIQKSDRTCANTVGNPIGLLVRWGIMKEFIRARSHISAPIVRRDSATGEAYLRICRCTRDSRDSCVPDVARDSHAFPICRHIERVMLIHVDWFQIVLKPWDAWKLTWFPKRRKMRSSKSSCRPLTIHLISHSNRIP